MFTQSYISIHHGFIYIYSKALQGQVWLCKRIHESRDILCRLRHSLPMRPTINNMASEQGSEHHLDTEMDTSIDEGQISLVLERLNRLTNKETTLLMQVRLLRHQCLADSADLWIHPVAPKVNIDMGF